MVRRRPFVGLGMIVVAAVVGNRCPAYAAGFQVSEQSVVGLGRSFAGAGIVGDDLSAVFFNPPG